MRLGRWNLSGSVFVDDWDPGVDEPVSLGLTATAATSFGMGSLWFGYTMVTNLAYRTNDPAEKALTAIDTLRGRFGVGLARNYSDYDQTTLRLTTVPTAGVILTPELALLRQGEGDPRLPFPDREEFDQTPTLFAGVMERTWRAALLSTVHMPHGFEARLDLGVHHVQNVGNQSGLSDTRVVGTAMLRYGFWYTGRFD